MNNEIEIFDIEGQGWRFGTAEDGRPFAVASDVAKTFGQRSANEVVRLLDDDEVGTHIVRTRSSNGVEQNREMSVIYKEGIWELIFLSRKPEAKAIKKRVKEVLRKIEETGGFLSPTVDFSDPDNLRQVFENWAADRKKLEATEAALIIESAKVNELSPKASAFDAYLDDVGELNFRRVMGIVRQINLNIKEYWVRDLLYDTGHIEKFSFTATSKAVNAGYMKNKAGTAPNGFGYVQGRFTPKGVRWLLKVIIGNGDARRVSDAFLDEIAEDLV